MKHEDGELSYWSKFRLPMLLALWWFFAGYATYAIRWSIGSIGSIDSIGADGWARDLQLAMVIPYVILIAIFASHYLTQKNRLDRWWKIRPMAFLFFFLAALYLMFLLMISDWPA